MAHKFTAHSTLISELFDDKTYDFHFYFSAEYEHIFVHKKLISAISPKFRELFSGAWKNLCKVEVDDSTHEAFNAFLQYFYKNEINITEDNVRGIRQLAKKYEVEEVYAECTAFMVNRLSIDSVVELYSASIADESCQFQYDFERFISKNIRDVLKTDGFLRCGSSVITAIMKLDQFQCSMMEMLEACIEWAKTQCQQKQIDPSDATNLRKEMTECYEHIRFDEIDLEHVIEIGRKYKGTFFSRDELHKLFVGDDEKDDDKQKKKSAKVCFPFKNRGLVRIVNSAQYCFRFSVSETMKLMEVGISNVIVNIRRDIGIPSSIALKLIKDEQIICNNTKQSTKHAYVQINFENGFMIEKDEIYELQVTIDQSKASVDKRKFVRIHQLVDIKRNDVDLRIHEAGAQNKQTIIGELIFEKCNDTLDDEEEYCKRETTPRQLSSKRRKILQKSKN